MGSKEHLPHLCRNQAACSCAGLGEMTTTAKSSWGWEPCHAQKTAFLSTSPHHPPIPFFLPLLRCSLSHGEGDNQGVLFRTGCGRQYCPLPAVDRSFSELSWEQAKSIGVKKNVWRQFDNMIVEQSKSSKCIKSPAWAFGQDDCITHKFVSCSSVSNSTRKWWLRP